MEKFDIRAYYHQRVLKKSYLLSPAAVFDIRYGKIVPGDKFLGLRQKQNSFSLEQMLQLVQFFVQEHPIHDTTWFGTKVRSLSVPEGLTVDALNPKKVLQPWDKYGEWQDFDASAKSRSLRLR